MSEPVDLSRWRETPRGVGYRRWAIVIMGLRQLLRTRFFRVLLAVAWTGGLLIAAAGFVFSQSVAEGGWLASIAHRFGARGDAVMSILSGFVALFPDIMIHGIFTLIFWIHSDLGLWLSLVALAVLTPQLVTRDRASNALIVYMSRPLTSLDYLLGKLGIIAGVLLLVWTGPLLAGWLLSMLFATDRDFIYYSLQALGRALLFNGIALVALAAIALGVSAATRTSRYTIILWVGLWAFLAVVAAPSHAPAWLKRASFSRDLHEIRAQIFQVDGALTNAAQNLPLLNDRLAATLTEMGKRSEPTDFNGALAALGVYIVLSSVVFFRRLRPE